jgi:hypothetical protein
MIDLRIIQRLKYLVAERVDLRWLPSDLEQVEYRVIVLSRRKKPQAHGCRLGLAAIE